MSVLGQVIAVMLAGFITGALARFAIPGPDPMPAWLTIAIGIVGSVIGGAIGAAVTGRNAYGISIGSFLAAVLLVVGYRKLVQKRAVLGFEALRYPRRGVGVQDYRERLARAGVDPDELLERALAERSRPRERDADSPPSADDEHRNGDDPKRNADRTHD
jgi:uncharacterized membrane protein YeaQ/YmgE (transglycosylase-associated protein family)